MAPDTDAGTYPSRNFDRHGREEYISTLLRHLAELEKKTNPAGGVETAMAKDLRAFRALQTAGELVRAVAGWALDHQFGLALQGLQFVPLQPSGTKTHPEYLEQRGRVDSHEHECEGAAASRKPTINPDTARRLLINLVLANPGAFPFCVQQNTIEALRTLEFGEVLPLLRPKDNPAKRGYRELRGQLQALGFVEYQGNRVRVVSLRPQLGSSDTAANEQDILADTPVSTWRNASFDEHLGSATRELTSSVRPPPDRDVKKAASPTGLSDAPPTTSKRHVRPGQARRDPVPPPDDDGRTATYDIAARATTSTASRPSPSTPDGMERRAPGILT